MGKSETNAKKLIFGIPTPCFFPSVSSVSKNVLTPLQHLEILVALNYPQFLVSAYDLYFVSNSEINHLKKLYEKINDQFQIIMLDSGIYEDTWRKDKSWSEEKYKKIINSYPGHIRFNYDRYSSNGNLEKQSLDIVQTLKNTDMDLCPILHAKHSSDFPEMCYLISENIQPDMIAIPERELGNGILDCAKTVFNIRSKLKDLNRYQQIHILGTGNPLSILVYTACGADSFDGLDWCQTVVDFKTATLHHIQQLDFFSQQSVYGDDHQMSYMARLFAHNHTFYQEWLNKIESNIQTDTIDKLLASYLPSLFYQKLSTLLKRD